MSLVDERIEWAYNRLESAKWCDSYGVHPSPSREHGRELQKYYKAFPSTIRALREKADWTFSSAVWGVLNGCWWSMVKPDLLKACGYVDVINSLARSS